MDIELLCIYAGHKKHMCEFSLAANSTNLIKEFCIVSDTLEDKDDSVS